MKRAAAVLMFALLAAGCARQAEMPPRQRIAADAPGTYQTELFASIAQSLHQIEELESLGLHKSVPLALNEWIAKQPAQDRWRPSPLVDDLPAAVKSAAGVRSIAARKFVDTDLRYLQQAVWTRDVSNWARGGEFDDLKVAQKLFDWTVRNVQLDAEPQSALPLRPPLDVLWFGRGRAIERSWVFMLLARAQGLDVVLLKVGPSQSPRYLPALAGEDQQLYVFDAELGLPLPGPAAQPVATVAQLAADDALLRKLDLADTRYPATAADFARVEVLLEASPQALSQRMAQLESRLSGKQRLPLAAAVDAQAERLRRAAHVAAVKLWEASLAVSFEQSLTPAAAQGADTAALGFEHPSVFTVIETDPDLAEEGKQKQQKFYTLKLGRWRHLRHRWDGDKGARRAYLLARMTKSRLDAVTDPEARRLAVAAKQCASYWLGLMALDEEHYSNAVDFLDQRLLKAWEGSSWTDGARYNLARAYEAQGKPAEAAALYESDRSPQSHGNRLRARALKPAATAATR